MSKSIRQHPARHIVITGAAQGIGLATAKRFAQADEKLILLDIDEPRLRREAAKLRDAGHNIMTAVCDVGNEAAVSATFADLAGQISTIDVLVNNAVAFVMEGITASAEAWRKVMDVNVIGTASCVKCALPLMRAAGGGAIVNLASISAHIAQAGCMTYNASKAAIVSMTQCMAQELSADHIRVNAVSPGTIWTASNAQRCAQKYELDRQGADAHPQIGGAHMLQRCGDPSEIAAAIFFLASDDASFITAETLRVDAGYTAQ